jgi:hypothetical protein
MNLRPMTSCPVAVGSMTGYTQVDLLATPR